MFLMWVAMEASVPIPNFSISPSSSLSVMVFSLSV